MVATVQDPLTKINSLLMFFFLNKEVKNFLFCVAFN